MVVVVGCCGFCTSMESYFKNYMAVEVQKTFYKPPNPETAKRWRNKASKINPNFEFTVKAWQIITHPPSSPTYRKAGIRCGRSCADYGYFRLSNVVMEAWEKTRNIADILRAKIIVFQTPPSFRETEENFDRIVQFFSTIENSKYVFVWEPRGWKNESVRKICEKVNLIHCVDPFVSDPSIVERVSYFRLHGKTKEQKYSKMNYRHVYSEEELEWLGKYIKNLMSEKIYVMFNNINMCKDAKKFLKILSTKK